MAQQRYCVVYKETDKSHLKLVGKLYDQCQDTLVQFGTFLGSTMSMEDYINKFPSIHSMLSEFHIHADVAFFLARPTFSHAINLLAKYEVLRKADPNSKKMSLTAKHQKYCEAVKEIMDPIVLSVRPLHPLKVWEDISPQFLVSFWSLTMYDLFVPVESYQREVNKLKQLSLQVMDSKDTAVSKLKKEQESTQLDLLFTHLDQHREHNARAAPTASTEGATNKMWHSLQGRESQVLPPDTEAMDKLVGDDGSIYRSTRKSWLIRRWRLRICSEMAELLKIKI
uniref:THO complex subunitTHOC2 C-terminal domain-containing protein n=1 Tax=Timema cristinae TaxID=61476 RepID=A0A7R9D2T6_TIMCR|nr:unnamed protein product [Timema cristinae]